MNQQAFEARVLETWMKTRIPLTRANLMAVTHAPRKKMERWLEELVREGVLEMDADDDGEMVWTVRGAVRPKAGPASVAELDKMERLKSEIGHASRALTLAARGVGLVNGRPHGAGPVPDEKSLVASGALSFFLGPIGWFYAAPLKEAIPAAALYWFVFFYLHLWVLMPLLFLVNAASGLAGVAYAWRYNQHGERTPILDGDKALPPRR